MSDVSETKSSLYFGSRAMKITNTAYVNVEVRSSWEKHEDLQCTAFLIVSRIRFLIT